MNDSTSATPNTPANKSVKSVTVYSADWCAFCHAVKNYLDSKDISYTEKNIEDKANGQQYAQESVEKSGQTGIPVIDIDGTIIVGFDRPKINAALGL